jgi:hypothetical protein
MPETPATIEPISEQKSVQEKVNRAISLACGLFYLGGLLWGLLSDDAIRSRVWWFITRVLQNIAGSVGGFGIRSEKAYYATVEMMHS